tara:strand:+ start:150 stop:836 length:687 start_codon:yes stop_codon:yes gene_type:complete
MKKAMILSAGFGKRLSPLTKQCPKPLLKIGNETLLSNTINFLEQFGIKEVTINVHYLGDQIIDYINKKKFNLNIKIVHEKEKILDTGGGILNALDNFNESFLCINPDTIWNFNYIKEVKKMEKEFFLNKNKCSMLLVDKLKSFDKNLKGDFNLNKNLVNRQNEDHLKYIYTGLQIIKPEVFFDTKEKVFSINKIWNNLIKKKELFGLESKIDFLHVSTLEIYNNLNIK